MRKERERRGSRTRAPGAVFFTVLITRPAMSETTLTIKCKTQDDIDMLFKVPAAFH